jgi:hypothetical protein
VPPARAVAITSAKTTAAAQAIAQPKRRRSFTGEPRAAAERARPAEAARPAHRTRRRTFEDEATIRQPLNMPLAPVAAVPAGAPPAAAKHEHSAIFDDLDEDTRVLQHKPAQGTTDDIIDQAFERLRAGNASGSEAQPPEADTISGLPVQMFTHAVQDPATPPTGDSDRTITGPLPGLQAAREAARAAARSDVGPASGTTRAEAHRPHPVTMGTSPPNPATAHAHEVDGHGPATERPASIPDASPAVAAPPALRGAKRVEALPALRVAVLATSVPGEVRLIALEPTDDAPPGAALAVLVPLTPADGESVTRLFGSLE